MKKILVGLLAITSLATFAQSFSERSTSMQSGLTCFMSIDVNSYSVAEGVEFCQDLVEAKREDDLELSKSFSDRLESLKSRGVIED